MAKGDANAVESLRRQTGLSAKQCENALKEQRGDVRAALEALVKSGKVERTRMDPASVPEELFGQAAIDSSMRALKELGVDPAVIKQVHEQIAAGGTDLVQQAGQIARMNARAAQKEQELRSKKLKDGVFGTLKWTVWWEGKAKMPSLGKNVALSVEADDGQPPSDEQRHAYQSLQAMGDALRRAVEQASYDYYRRARPNYLEQSDEDDAPEIMPLLKDAAEIWRLLSCPTVHIPARQSKGWTVELGFNCAWDEEHGHEVVLRKGKVVHVSIQGEGWE